MKLRAKADINTEASSSKFNTHALNEIICFWPEGDADSVFISDFDVFITANNIGWKDMNQAFHDKNIITDNYNIYFFEPANEEDKKRGFTL